MKYKLNYLFTHSPLHILNAIYSKFATKYKLLYASFEPRTIQIEPTNRCNMQCIQCPRTNQPKTSKKPLNVGDLNLENFIKIINQFKYLDCVTLHGLGEAFLNPEIFDIIRYAKKKNILIDISSNVSLLNEDICRKLVEVGINTKDDLVLSIDSFNKESFEKIRPPIKLEKIIDNLNILMKICRGKINIYLRLIVLNENLDYLEDYIEVADSYGVKQVSFSDPNISAAGEDRDKLMIKEPAKLKRTIDNIIRISKEKGMYFSYYKLDSNIWGSRKTKHPCWFLWCFPYITWDGYVTPCCTRPFPNEFNFGNLYKIPFEKIWNGKKYREFRKSLKRSDIPELCEGCPHSKM